jgi:hypothetical protein
MARHPEHISHWQEAIFVTSLLLFAWIGRGLFPIPDDAMGQFALIERAHASGSQPQTIEPLRCDDVPAGAGWSMSGPGKADFD